MEGAQEMFGNIDKMFGAGMNFMNNPEGAPGENGQMPEMNEDMLDQYADMLLNQMIDKDIIYEPLIDAKKQMEEFLKKENIQVNAFSKTKNIDLTSETETKKNESTLSEVDKNKALKQYSLICEIIDLIDLEESDKSINNKEKIKDKFEELHNAGGLPKQLMGNNEFMTFLNGPNSQFDTQDFFGNKDGEDPECRIF